MPDDKIADKSKTPPALSGITRHAANETAWYAISTAPDYCKVGKSVVGFDTYAVLSNKATASPNVKAQIGAKPIYRVDDLVKGVQGNAGAGVCSGTSLDLGYLKFVSGQYNLHVNGKSVVIDGSRCFINCNAAGFGNAAAVVRTEVKAASSKGEKTVLDGMREESGRVVEKEVSDYKKMANALWDARPFNSDEAVSGAARSKISNALQSAAEGLATLIGPPPEQVQGALMSGNPEAIAAVTEAQQRQYEGYKAIVGQTKKAWNEAEERNGKSGASAMVFTVGALQFLGGKGAGLMARVGKRIAAVVGLAKTPLEAAALLDKEIAWAKAVGKSDAEIKMWREARDKQLDLARRKAADPKQAEGVHVKKGRLTPNAEYELNGYKYKTDGEGRIKSAEGELRLEEGTRRPSQQTEVGLSDGRQPGDAGGHLIGNQFDGYGGRENLVPMGQINNYHAGEWGQMEKNWAARLRAGDSVHVKIDVLYNDVTMRPSSFKITEIINGKAEIQTIVNR